MYNEELINSLKGGIDNIYASSLELPSDCLTNPSKVDLNSCESLHPKDIYQNMDKSEVNEPMQPQAPLEQQVGVSNLTEKINQTFKKIRGEGVINEKNLESALREIRIALLEADVA